MFSGVGNGINIDVCINVDVCINNDSCIYVNVYQY